MKKTSTTLIMLCLALHSFSKYNLKDPATQFTGVSKQQQMPFAVADTGDTTVNAYCNSAGLITTFGYIKRIVFGSIDNTSGNNGGYGNFTSVKTNISKGKTYTLQVQAGFRWLPHSERWTVYIDYNGDGDFNDAGEKIGSAVTNTAALVGKAFQIPVTAKTGISRMRIQMQYNIGNANPCGKFISGEVEDYTLNIVDDLPGDPGGDPDPDDPGGPGDPGTDPDGLLPNSLSVSPNPVVSSSVRLNYTLTKGGNVSFKLIDANGLTRGNYKPGIQIKGANSYTINNISSLHNGYYYVFVEKNGRVIGKVTLLVAH